MSTASAAGVVHVRIPTVVMSTEHLHEYENSPEAVQRATKEAQRTWALTYLQNEGLLYQC